MNSRRDLTKLSKEELEKLAKTYVASLDDDTQVRIPNDKSQEAESFIIAKGIKPGATKIQAQMLYYEYLKWKNYKGVVKPSIFYKQIKPKFSNYKGNHGITYYMLDPEPFNLTEEYYFKMKQEMRDIKDEAQKESQKQKSQPKKKVQKET